MSSGRTPAPGFSQKIALQVASVGGVGKIPIAPGTAGSLVGVLLYAALYFAGPVWPFVATLAAAALAVWSGGVAERMLGRKDPQVVVADEVAGQMLCLLGAAPAPAHLLAGFFLFRALDIIKPFRRAEKLPGGWGIVADDLLAGAGGWVLLAAARAMGWL
ncbi:MAG: phosphatidylglycerophosphatase A [bacterium]|nr:phosphatidylglycerophosphatase A [bacterium]